MSDAPENRPMMMLKSSRFGELEVPVDSIITLPSGLIGFPKAQRFVMLDYKPPFSWLHSVDDPALAFVVVDGAEFGDSYIANAPFGDKDTGIKQGSEYAALVIVTVRPDPRETTANLKAPVFVNIENRKGVQIIFDNPEYSTRFPLWAEKEEESGENNK